MIGYGEEALVRLVVLVDTADSTKAKADEPAMRIAPRLRHAVAQVLPNANSGGPSQQVALSLARDSLTRPRDYALPRLLA